MTRWVFSLFAMLMAVYLAPDSASAANIRLPNAVEAKTCSLVLEGEIAPGDAEQLSLANREWDTKLAPDIENEASAVATTSLCLNSIGGSYSESIKLMQTIKDSNLMTVVAGNAQCYSACALAFMAGSITVEEVVFNYRFLVPGGKLGFHAPYIAMNSDVSAGEMEELWRIGNEVVFWLLSYGSTLDISPSLVSEMMLYGPKELLFVETIYDARRWWITILGKTKKEIAISKSNVHVACLNNHHYWALRNAGSPQQIFGGYMITDFEGKTAFDILKETHASRDEEMARLYDVTASDVSKQSKRERYVVTGFPPEGLSSCFLDVKKDKDGKQQPTISIVSTDEPAPKFGEGAGVNMYDFLPATSRIVDVMEPLR